MPDKKINFSISEGSAFFAHELSINFNPTQFIFDFKCITPRVDPRSREGAVISISHNTIMVDPYHATRIVDFLSKRIKDYEKEFGRIHKPPQVEAAEKKRKDTKTEFKEEPANVPDYFG